MPEHVTFELCPGQKITLSVEETRTLIRNATEALRKVPCCNSVSEDVELDPEFGNQVSRDTDW